MQTAIKAEQVAKDNQVISNEPEQPQGEKQNPLVMAVKIFVGIAMLFAVLYWAGPKKLLLNLQTANHWYLGASIGLVLTSYVIAVKRWQLLSESLGFHQDYLRYLMLHFIGLFSSNFLLSAVGGDVVKAFYISKKDEYHKAILSVFLDRYVGLLVLLVVASVMAFFQPQDEFHRRLAIITWVLLATFLIGAAAALIFTKPIVKLLQRFNLASLAEKVAETSDLTRNFIANVPLFGVTLGLSIFSQAAAIMAVYELSLAVGAQASPVSMFVIVPMVFLVSVIPISFVSGPKDLVLAYLLTNAYILSGMNLDTAKSDAALVTVLWLAVNFLTSLPGSILTSMVKRLKH